MTAPVHEDSLLTVNEVAARLTVSPKTVRRLVERGELPALKIGASVRVDPGELQAWLYAVPGHLPRHEGATGETGPPSPAAPAPPKRWEI